MFRTFFSKCRFERNAAVTRPTVPVGAFETIEFRRTDQNERARLIYSLGRSRHV